MGLLTKALEITWAKSVELQGVIPSERDMHLLMCVFAATERGITVTVETIFQIYNCVSASC